LGNCYGLREHGIPVGLKWPNDLMLCGRKLGGILTETRCSKDESLKQWWVWAGLTQYPKQASICCYPSKQISLLYCLSGNLAAVTLLHPVERSKPE